MVSKEEQELIELRKAWADLPLLNFWHDTNDAPDSFFDKLLASARGDDETFRLKPNERLELIA